MSNRKVNVMNRLPFSVMKNNVLFSISLSLIYTIITVILILLTFFSPSVNASIDSFLTEYLIPDAEIMTEGTMKNIENELKDVEGISAVESILMTEGKTTFKDGKKITIRYSIIPGDSICHFYNTVSKEDVVLSDESVLISSKYAERNNVNAGDVLEVSLFGQKVSLKVTDVVSCPDTIYGARDMNSWFDNTQYAFVYVSEEALNKSIHLPEVSNLFHIWFEENADAEKTLDSACSLINNAGNPVVSSTLKKDSSTYYQIHSTIDAVNAIVTYLPSVIFLMGILFCGFFVYQIIYSSRNMVGIYQALGMGTGQICGIFIRYNIILASGALLLGGIISYPILRFLLNIYKDVLALPKIILTGKLSSLIIVVLAVYAIGVLACIICIRAISSNDPAMIFTDTADVTGDSKTPQFIRKIKMNAYSKITIAAFVRNKKRLVVMTLCNVACLLLTFLSFSVIMSKFTGIKYVFEERFAYDYIVITDDADCLNEVSSMSDVLQTEQVATTVLMFEDEYMRIEALDKEPSLTRIYSVDGTILGIPEEGIILEEGFARRHNLSKGDTFKVNDVSLKVMDISREYFYSTQYVSFETAALLGAGSANAIYVRLSNSGNNSELFVDALSQIEDVDCFYSIAERKAASSNDLRMIDVPCYLFCAFGIMIGLVIVSNINILSINQRKKEYSTLTVLGTSGEQFLEMLLLDSIVQFLISVIVGIPAAAFLSKWILGKMSSMSMEFVLVRVGIVSVAAAGTILLYLLLSLFSAKKTIDKLNLVENMAKR